MGELKEKCGIVGIYGKDLPVSRLAFFALFALQHRGQEASGITTNDGKKLHTHKGAGLVPQIYTEKNIEDLKGYIGIGHNRYSTSGGGALDHAQPVVNKEATFALAHNGNLPSVKKLEKFLASKKALQKNRMDSELITDAIDVYIKEGNSLPRSVKKAFPLITGAFSLVMMNKDTLIAIRDTYGMRPLALGRFGKGYVVASETCALQTIGATFARDVKPGEMIVINKNGIKSIQLAPPNPKHDIFEYVYFARPDSVLNGKLIYEVRKNFGKALAYEFKIKVDAIVPVPDTATPVALGYSEASGIPIEMALVKNRYVHRTFIEPDQKSRRKSVALKLIPLPSVLKGKKIALIDDSIVRGHTCKRLVETLFKSGAKEVHLLISSPPIRFPDFYGMDTPNQNELIASHKTIEEIRKFLGATSLNYLSLDGLIKSIGLPEKHLSTSCFSGIYPIDLKERKDEVNYDVPKNKKKLVLLVHERGTQTNLKAIKNAIDKGKINAEISAVVSEKEDAMPIIERISPDYICLSGWKKIIPNEMIEKYENKILNLHPGLIPDSRSLAYGKLHKQGFWKNHDSTKALWNKGMYGNKAIANFLNKKATYAGSSVHFLTLNFDFGPVLGRTFEKIKAADNVESLYKRLKKKENKLYVKVLEKLCKNKRF